MKLFIVLVFRLEIPIKSLSNRKNLRQNSQFTDETHYDYLYDRLFLNSKFITMIFMELKKFCVHGMKNRVKESINQKKIVEGESEN